MTDNKKLGIRLKYLEQKDDEKKRDISPGAANRKKIFEKLPYQKIGERQNLEQKLRSPKPMQPQTDNSEVEKLIENLKRKSMQVQLRDNVIKSLNKEIDELKRDLKTRERQIVRLNSQINRLDKTNRTPKNVEKQAHVFESFRDPVPNDAFRMEDRKREYQRQMNPSFDRVGNALPEEITMMNLQSRQNERRQVEEPEILSPFMALTNKKNEPTYSNQDPYARDHAQTFSAFSNGGVKTNESSNPIKSSIVNPFDRPIQSPFSQTSSSFSKKPPGEYEQNKGSNAQKFNIFNQQSARSQLRPSNTKLTIEDSREFKFEEFDQSDFH